MPSELRPYQLHVLSGSRFSIRHSRRNSPNATALNMETIRPQLGLRLARNPSQFPWVLDCSLVFIFLILNRFEYKAIRTAPAATGRARPTMGRSRASLATGTTAPPTEGLGSGLATKGFIKGYLSTAAKQQIE